jgi:hypothetical protein
MSPMLHIAQCLSTHSSLPILVFTETMKVEPRKENDVIVATQIQRKLMVSFIHPATKSAMAA